MAKYKKNDGDAFDDGSVRPLFGDDEEFGPDYNDQSNDLINRKKGGIDFSHGGSGFAATAEDALKEEEKAKALEEAQEKMNKYLLEKDVKKAELAKKRAEQRKVARQKAQQEYSDAAKISKDEKRAARQETVAEGHSRQAEIHQAEAQLAEATKKEIEKENVIHSARQEVDVHSDVVGMKEHGTKEQTEDHLEKAEKQREERIFQEEISKEELKAETKAQFDKDRADMDARLAEQEAKYTEIAEQQSAAVRNETVAADLAGKEAEKLRREENARKTKEAYISEADERKKIELAKKGEYESYEAKKLDLEIKKTEKAYSQQLGLDPDLVEKEYRKAQREAKKSCESITETRMREAMEQDGIRTQIATKQEQLRANQEAKFFQDRAETEEGQQLKKQQKKMLEAKADAKPETKKILTTPEVIKDASQAKSRLVDQMAMSLKRKVSRITDIDKRIAEINEGLKAGNIMQSNANKSIFMLMRERNKLLGTIKDKKILSKFGYKAPVALAKKIGGAKGAAGRRLGNAVLGTRFGKQVMAISRKLEKTTIARQFKRGVKGVNKLGAKGMAIAAQAGKNMAQTRQQIRVLLKKNRRMLSSTQRVAMASAYLFKSEKQKYDYEGSQTESKLNIAQEGMKRYGQAAGIMTGAKNARAAYQGIKTLRMTGAAAGGPMGWAAAAMMYARNYFSKIWKNIGQKANDFVNAPPNILNKIAAPFTAVICLVTMVVGISGPLTDRTDKDGAGSTPKSPIGWVVAGASILVTTAYYAPAIANFFTSSGISTASTDPTFPPYDPKAQYKESELMAACMEVIEAYMNTYDAETNTGVNMNRLTQLHLRTNLPEKLPDGTDNPNYISPAEYKQIKDMAIREESRDPARLLGMMDDDGWKEIQRILMIDDIEKYHATYQDQLIIGDDTFIQYEASLGAPEGYKLLPGMNPIDHEDCPHIIHKLRYNKGMFSSFDNDPWAQYERLDEHGTMKKSYKNYREPGTKGGKFIYFNYVPILWNVYDSDVNWLWDRFSGGSDGEAGVKYYADAITKYRSDILAGYNIIMNEFMQTMEAHMKQFGQGATGGNWNQSPPIDLFNNPNYYDQLIHHVPGYTVFGYVIDGVQPAPGSASSFNPLDIIIAAAYSEHDGGAPDWDIDKMAPRIREIIREGNLFNFYYQETIKYEGSFTYRPLSWTNAGIDGIEFKPHRESCTNPNNWAGEEAHLERLEQTLDSAGNPLISERPKYPGVPTLHRTYYYSIRSVRDTEFFPTWKHTDNKLNFGNGNSPDYSRFSLGGPPEQIDRIIDPMIRTYPDDIVGATKQTLGIEEPNNNGPRVNNVSLKFTDDALNPINDYKVALNPLPAPQQSQNEKNAFKDGKISLEFDRNLAFAPEYDSDGNLTGNITNNAFGNVYLKRYIDHESVGGQMIEEQMYMLYNSSDSTTWQNATFAGNNKIEIKFTNIPIGKYSIAIQLNGYYDCPTYPLCPNIGCPDMELYSPYESFDFLINVMDHDPGDKVPPTKDDSDSTNNKYPRTIFNGGLQGIPWQDVNDGKDAQQQWDEKMDDLESSDPNKALHGNRMKAFMKDARKGYMGNKYFEDYVFAAWKDYNEEFRYHLPIINACSNLSLDYTHMEYTTGNNINWQMLNDRILNRAPYTGPKYMRYPVQIENSNRVITSQFLELRNVGTSPHVGTDFRAGMGDKCLAVCDGEITEISNSGVHRMVLTFFRDDIRHEVHYIHGQAKVGLGPVQEGQHIYTAWNYGTGSPHLHLEFYRGARRGTELLFERNFDYRHNILDYIQPPYIIKARSENTSTFPGMIVPFSLPANNMEVPEGSNIFYRGITGQPRTDGRIWNYVNRTSNSGTE